MQESFDYKQRGAQLQAEEILTILSTVDNSISNSFIAPACGRVGRQPSLFQHFWYHAMVLGAPATNLHIYEIIEGRVVCLYPYL